MEYIGDKISIKKIDNETSIVILSSVDKMKNRMLFLWFALWTLGGIVVFVEYFLIPDEQTRIAIMVWLGFWAYFEFKIYKAVMWRAYGVEKIKLRDRKLFYKRDVRGRGKIQVYEFDFMKDFRIVETKENSFFENLNNSYWAIAGEKLSFDYYGKEIKMALQIDEASAKALYKLIKNKM
jgi:hypothetical protein